MQLFRNASPVHGSPIPPVYGTTLDRAAPVTARRYFSVLADFHPTPLVSLDGLANVLGVGKILYKDEGHRLGLQSFKALGGAYAVARLVHRHAERKAGRKIPVEELTGAEVRKHTGEFTVACATDGNHGRSVAWGAQLLGCPCVIFLHEHVSQKREEAITAFRARIVRVPGVYDDSCAEAARVAAENGWQIVSDFALVPYHEVTSWVMQGYTVMVDEILQSLAERREKVSHIFLQGGCGGLAAAVAGHFHGRAREKPTIVVVEPDRASCLLQSARRNAITRIGVTQPTCMAMLECYEPSHMAWPILERTVDFFMAISDQTAMEAARLVNAGASGAAGLAGLLAGHKDEQFMQALGLSRESSVLLIGSEGAIE